MSVPVKVRNNPPFSLERSRKAAAKFSFIKAKGAGSLKTQGIKRHFKTYPRMIYVFNPNARVAGTREEIEAYLSTAMSSSDIASVINTSGMGYEQFIAAQAAIEAKVPGDAGLVAGAALYKAEIDSKPKSTRRKLFDPSMPLDTFEQLRRLATNLDIKSDKVKPIPAFTDLKEMYARKTAITDGLIARYEFALRQGKILKVSDLKETGQGTRVIDAPKTEGAKNKRSMHIPGLYSDNLATYAIALQMMANDDPSRFQYSAAYNEMAMKFGGMPPAPVAPRATSPPIPARTMSSVVSATPFVPSQPMRLASPRSPLRSPRS